MNLEQTIQKLEKSPCITKGDVANTIRQYFNHDVKIMRLHNKKYVVVDNYHNVWAIAYTCKQLLHKYICNNN